VCRFIYPRPARVSLLFPNNKESDNLDIPQQQEESRMSDETPGYEEKHMPVNKRPPPPPKEDE